MDQLNELEADRDRLTRDVGQLEYETHGVKSTVTFFFWRKFYTIKNSKINKNWALQREILLIFQFLMV